MLRCYNVTQELLKVHEHVFITDGSQLLNNASLTPGHRGAFVRTPVTWVAYLVLGYYAYMQAVVGPLMAFLRSELHLTYTLQGLHFSAFALGAIGAGVTGDSIIRRLGRHAVLWGGGAGLAVGALALIGGRYALWTLFSVVLMGYAGNLLLISNQAALSDTHGEQRSIALLEANVVASVGASLAPLSLSLFQAVGPGWRTAPVLMVGVFLLLFVLLRRIAIPDAAAAASHHERITLHMPAAFWAYWIVVIVGVAIEWGMVYWSTDFLMQAGGVSPARAAAWLTVFFLAALIGRFGSSRLARRIPARRLIVLAIGVAAAGFVLFWLAPILALRLVGLLLAGLGMATFYPLGVALTLGTVPQQADSGSARLALGAGLAAVIVPFLLGAVADWAGLWRAYSIVAVLLLGMISMVTVANHMTRRAHT